MSVCLLHVLLGEVSVPVLCPVFNWIVCPPGVELCEFFIYFGYQTLVQGIVANFHMVVSLSILLMCPLAMQKLLSLM